MSKAAELAALIGSQSALSNRNLIINGAMGVSQRGTSAVTASGSGTFSLDRFKAFQNGDGGFDVSQSTVAPTGFNNSLKVDVTGADASIDAGAYKLLYYNFEGQDMSHLEWGTSNAKTITLSFWVRSTTTGNHSVGIRGGDASYNSYMTTYNIAVANTWEYKTVTIPGDTTASFTYDTDNTLWGVLVFSFATGSTYTVSSNNTFHAGNFIQATGAVNLFSSASNDWYITGLQLEVGEQATPFEHRSYGDELARCQRYYEQLLNHDGSFNVIATYRAGSDYRAQWLFKTEKRATPTMGGTFNATLNATYISTQMASYYRTVDFYGNSTLTATAEL
jgi:hypothetical protein